MAYLARPTQLAQAPDGPLFVLEVAGGRVREISGGAIQTFAGGGTEVATDSPIPAASISLSPPKALAISTAGDILVLDARGPGATGALLAIARRSGHRYGKDLVAGSAVPLFIPTSTPSPMPGGIAAGPGGDLYLPDPSNNVVWRLDITGAFTAFAGSGTLATATGSAAGDGGPAATANLGIVGRISVDSAGHVFLSEKGAANRIRMVCMADGTHFGIAMTRGNIYPIAGRGPFSPTGAADIGDLGQPSNPAGDALGASFRFPDFIAFDPAGNAFVMDAGNFRIRRIDRRTRVITTVAGRGVITSTAAGLGDGGPAGLATFQNAAGLAFDPSGDLLVADDKNHRIRKISQVP